MLIKNDFENTIYTKVERRKITHTYRTFNVLVCFLPFFSMYHIKNNNKIVYAILLSFLLNSKARAYSVLSVLFKIPFVVTV